MSVSPRARIGSNVVIGRTTVVHDDVVIEDDTVIGEFCILGEPSPLAEGPLVLRRGTLIRSHSVFYAGSELGAGLRTGHHVTVRERTVAGQEVQLGSYADVQGHCVIGDFSRTHSSVQINHGCRLGRCVWMFPHSVLANDPHPPSNITLGVHVDDFAVIGMQACVLPGVRVGERSVVAAAALVSKDVPPGVLVAGVPARVVRPAGEVVRRDGSGLPAYPWTEHFDRGYPEALVRSWRHR